MDKVGLTIAKWEKNREVIQEQREAVALSGGAAGQAKGAVKEELSAMDAYIETFGMFIDDLYKLR